MLESLDSFQSRVNDSLSTLEDNEGFDTNSVHAFSPSVPSTWQAAVSGLSYSDAANAIPLWRDIGLYTKFQSDGRNMLVTVTGAITQANATAGLAFEVTTLSGGVVIPRSTTNLAMQNALGVGSGARLTGSYSQVIQLRPGVYKATAYQYAYQNNGTYNAASPCTIDAAAIIVRSQS